MVLLVVVYLAADRGMAGSFGWAVLGGLLQDVLGVGVPGINVFSKTTVCIVVSSIGRRVAVERPGAIVVLTFAATLMDMTIVYLLLAVVGLRYEMLFYLVRIMVPSAFYNSLVVPVVVVCAEQYTVWMDRLVPRAES